ncbi:MAG: hypothetical protein KDD55_12665 [Bdellovibrionales bacterium]|nr:hypothetical protein [Bdellovibrionales bacterium]
MQVDEYTRSLQLELDGVETRLSAVDIGDIDIPDPTGRDDFGITTLANVGEWPPSPDSELGSTLANLELQRYELKSRIEDERGEVDVDLFDLQEALERR